MIIDLADAKAHLNVIDETDDAVITRKIAAAEARIGALVTCSVHPDNAPGDVKEAARQLVAHLYADREGAASIPPCVLELLAPYREWAF